MAVIFRRLISESIDIMLVRYVIEINYVSRGILIVMYDFTYRVLDSFHERANALIDQLFHIFKYKMI